MNYAEVFSFSPNPTLMVQTSGIKGILFKMRYCVRAKQGLSMLLGDVGLGKSTLLRAFHTELSGREDTVTTILPTGKFPTALTMLKRFCDDLGVPRKKTSLDQQHAFAEFLIEHYKAGKTVVVMIDEAQLMDKEQLELIRTLLNHETNTHKLIQFVLAGQLDLANRLVGPRLRALKSRIFAPCTLNPLTLEESVEMIQSRCDYWSVPNPFPAPVFERMYQLTDGVPRLLLRLCAITAAVGEETANRITPLLVESVYLDLQLPTEEDSLERETTATAG